MIYMLFKHPYCMKFCSEMIGTFVSYSVLSNISTTRTSNIYTGSDNNNYTPQPFIPKNTKMFDRELGSYVSGIA